MRLTIRQCLSAFLCLFLVVSLLCTIIAPVWAAAPPTPTPAPTADPAKEKENEIRTRCELIRKVIIETDLDNAYLTEYVVACVKTTVREAFSKFAYGFYDVVHQAAMASLVLAVTIFGVLLATGAVEKSSRDSFVLLFKLACVLFFMQPKEVVRLYDNGMDAMDGLTEIVYTFGKSPTSNRCFDNYTLWDRVDCMLDVIIGIVREEDLTDAGKSMSSSGGSTEVQGISRGLLNFFSTNLFSTSVGALIGILGFYVTYTFLFALVKSIHTYLAAVIGLSFILVLAPMFVPMIMFRVTRSYFDKWMRVAISFILQPVILFGFLSLMMIAMDTMVISGNGSFMKTAMGDDADTRNASINETLSDGSVYEDSSAGAYGQVGDSARNIEDPRVTDRGMFRSVEEGASEGQRNRVRESNDFFGMHTTYQTIDYERLGEAADCGTPEECQEKLGMSIITIALTVFVFTSMLNYIPNMAADLSGGVYEVPNLFDKVGSKLPGSEQLGNLTGGASSRISEQLRGSMTQVTDQIRQMVGMR